MSDQNPEAPTAESELPPALGGDPAVKAAAETVLSLDEVLSSARLAERTVKICLRADLEADLMDTLRELSTLVDGDGKVLDDQERALGDRASSRAQELGEKARTLRSDMTEFTRVIRFRSLDDDAWAAFEKAHRGADGTPKDLRDYNNQLISRTAIAPTLTIDQVNQLRGKLSGKQMVEMANAAYSACTTGGLDVPKLPGFSHAQKLEE